MIRAYEFSNRIDYWIGVGKDDNEVSANPLVRVVKPSFGLDAAEDRDYPYHAQVVVLKRGLTAVGEYMRPEIVEEFAQVLIQASSDARKLDRGQRGLYPEKPSEHG